MIIFEVDKESYRQRIKDNFSVFNSVDFCEASKQNTDEMKYLLFNDGKTRFGLIIGIKNNVISIPFSAPYSCFDTACQDNKISLYHAAIKELSLWSKGQRYQEIKFSLPPLCYAPSELTYLSNALFVEGFTLNNIEVNYEFYMKDFCSNYVEKLSINPRKALRKSIKNNLSFEKTDDLETVYHIIKTNRMERGFPLRMSLKQVQNAQKVVTSDMFIVRDECLTPVASALVFNITQKISRVIYWANLSEYANLRPMNYLSYKMFEFYAEKGISILDIGHSTEHSIPNYGLCDFKQSIGCKSSPKYTFVLNLVRP